MKKTLLLIAAIACAFGVTAQDIKLNAPVKTGGEPLMKVFNGRHSERTFVKKAMPLQMMSDLLWASNGFNRENKRTVPTAQDKQELDIYVMTDEGVYLYEAKAHHLKQVAKGNFKEALGQANISNNASLSVIIVANLDKAASREYAYLSAGYISGHIYLFAESFGLGTVARGSFKKIELHKALKLTDKQEITLVQPVGFLK
ncbi:MAG: SagB/ThcOx family dehydrogenase [Culturomica sp.]|jgi:SagB-type dehydrogenase family enzyme|nr:SagB/ThcOx family dehydrogenase [Culturomica sp.]